MNHLIERINAREILGASASAIETTVYVSGGIQASASVPSGTSAGRYEAHDLRDRGTVSWNGCEKCS